MNFTYVHANLNVRDLDASIRFYEQALGLTEGRRKQSSDGSFTIVFMNDANSGCQVELTWLRDHPQPYDLGENEHHLCFRTDDFTAAHAHHAAMNCICYENTSMGLYFISDPDGYWIEIVPVR